MGKRILRRAELLACVDRKYETVEVPEWNGLVRLQSLSAAEREAWEAYLYKVTKEGMLGGDFRARLLVMAMVDEQGQRLFGDDETNLLAQKSAQVLERLFRVATRLSGLTEADLEMAEKN